MPANRAESLARVEPQYLDLVDFITAHPDQVISPASYLDWDRRDTDIDWVSDGKDTTVERAVGCRLSSLAVAHSLPLRPSIPSPYRRTVWIAALLDAGGAFYRTGHGKSASYVLDLQARWRRVGNHGRVELVRHRWPHNPNATVRSLLPAPVYAPDAPAVPETTAVPLDAVTYTVQAAGQHVGDQLVVRVDTPGGASALLLANVVSILPVVKS